MCQTGSRKRAADSIDIDQLHYLNAECPFWVFNIYFYDLDNKKLMFVVVDSVQLLHRIYNYKHQFFLLSRRPTAILTTKKMTNPKKIFLGNFLRLPIYESLHTAEVISVSNQLMPHLLSKPLTTK